MYKDRPILMLDLETTGLDKDQHCILSVGMKIVGSDLEKEILLRPDASRKVDPKAIEINKIDLTYHTIAGATNLQALAAIDKFLEDTIGDSKAYIAGRNVHFDVEFLEELYQRVYGESFKNRFKHQYFDVRTIANYLQMKGAIPLEVNLSVDSLHCYLFGDKEIQKKAHGALADVRMDEESFRTLLRKY